MKMILGYIMTYDLCYLCYLNVLILLICDALNYRNDYKCTVTHHHLMIYLVIKIIFVFITCLICISVYKCILPELSPFSWKNWKSSKEFACIPTFFRIDAFKVVGSFTFVTVKLKKVSESTVTWIRCSFITCPWGS